MSGIGTQLASSPAALPALSPHRLIDSSNEELIPEAPSHLTQHVVRCILLLRHARGIILVTSSSGHSAGHTAQQEGFIKCSARQYSKAFLEP